MHKGGGPRSEQPHARPSWARVRASPTLQEWERQSPFELASRYRLPAVYHRRFFATDGGLVYCGVDDVEHNRQVAAYIDRILRGEKPANLPVQAPTKYETVLNLKTAKTLGLNIPETLLATADEVIQ
jgi:putative tryptophan/tyrosine transport system substrate-binding protein